MEEKIQRLSEGMDFIEEACGTSSEPLVFSETDKIEISEGVSNPSPFKILGVAKGCFAPINEFSRNRRLYSPELWPTVLQNEELKSRLTNRAVFGCLGHADKLVDDRDIQEGKVSHIVTLLEVRNDEKTGKPYLYGELEILDTPAGRILEAMYKGGANLYVSSRAAGKLVPVPGQNYSLVKPDQYHVHTFDIVCRPGFLQAHPMFEAVSTNESITEEKKDLKDIKASEIDNDFTFDRSMNPYDEEGQKEKAEKLHKTLNDLPPKNESIEELKGQINQLAKILEKVVDDVYEQEEPKEETPEGAKEKEMEKKPEEAPQMQEQPIAPVKESLAAFIKLMADSNISEEAFSEVLDMIKGDLK